MNKHILKIYIFKQEISITELAKQLGISRSHLYNIIKCRVGISPRLAKKIEEYTHGEIKAMDLLYPKDNSDK
ncbi:MAG: helix-turn-helix domain-containing protein [Deltaproteobacteria bacterium]|jgi:plasmid maintenance system antidote protein VapI|nr:helix-turn-helix domain-containing protein [Deltaproteobacteria bacterium]